MKIYVIKRDGRKVPFKKDLILNAITAAGKEIYMDDEKSLNRFMVVANYMTDDIVLSIKHKLAEKDDNSVDVEAIQDIVENELLESDYPKVAQAYIRYRQKRTDERQSPTDKVIKEIVSGSSEYWNTENSNKDAKLVTTQRDYIAGAVSTNHARRFLFPKECIEAHNAGIIHLHDMDYAIQQMNNCGLVNLEDMLQYGTVISNVKIDKPHRFSTACNIATQIIAQVASNQYGGQSITLAHLSPFVQSTRDSLRRDFPDLTDDQLSRLVKRDISAGIQTLQYQIVTLMTTNGQAPFITVFANLAEVPEGDEREDLALVIEELLKQRIKGVKNSAGVYVAPAFPKIVYGLDECNVYEGSKYFYLTKLAAKCTAYRMVPDYQSNKVQRALKNKDIFPSMGCRSMLPVDRTKKNYAKALNYEKYKGHKYYGKFNKGVVTINLPDVALSSHKDMKLFWKIFKERLELCHKALRCRYEHLVGTKSDVAPILWQNGAYARLGKGEVIDELLKHGYSSISLGYAGLYECVYYMTGKSHTSKEGRDFALKIMKYMEDCCTNWDAKEDIGYSLYGSPIEATTYTFAKALRKRFGVVEGVTDHDYITNSYHVNVREPIDAFTKLKMEADFQKHSLGGCISYVEVPDLKDNVDVVIKLMQFIYENIMYAELNCKIDYCQKCGYSGEIKIKGEPGHLYWECPNCGNTDQSTMEVTRRTCGYLGTNFWNQGRTEEIKDRVLHLDAKERL